MSMSPLLPASALVEALHFGCLHLQWTELHPSVPVLNYWDDQRNQRARSLDGRPFLLGRQQFACHACKKLAHQKCGRCKKIAYCCKECQKGDWARHKAQCAA
jgi:hypothetical protein